MNEFYIIFHERRGFTNQGRKIVNENPKGSMCRSSNGTNNGSKWDVFLVNFWLGINFGTKGIVRKNLPFDSKF